MFFLSTGKGIPFQRSTRSVLPRFGSSSETWIANGDYAGAIDLVKRILNRERLISADRDPQGCVCNRRT